MLPTLPETSCDNCGRAYDEDGLCECDWDAIAEQMADAEDER